MRERKELDGTGAPLDDATLYFVQDARGCVGNCGSWWAPKGAGYVCNIEDAGRYTGADVRTMRDTDVPWPVDYVLARTVRHVRVDNQAFRRRDDHQRKYKRPARTGYIDSAGGYHPSPDHVGLFDEHADGCASCDAERSEPDSGYVPSMERVS